MAAASASRGVRKLGGIREAEAAVEGPIMHDQLLGATQPVLSISLEPGESVIAEVGGFAWMTDSIAMAEVDDARLEPRLCVYTATGEPGVVAFASKLPGRILSVEVGSGYEGYLVRESSFLAGTPGVRITAETGPRVPGSPGGQGLTLWRIGGSGRAWVELSGDVIRRELTAGQSLRAHPRHIGMFNATVAVQVAEVQSISGRDDDTYPCAVLSGPGEVWLRSMVGLQNAG
jgi:uncharacterized protein (AIM24 family)